MREIQEIKSTKQAIETLQARMSKQKYKALMTKFSVECFAIPRLFLMSPSRNLKRNRKTQHLHRKNDLVCIDFRNLILAKE